MKITWRDFTPWVKYNPKNNPTLTVSTVIVRSNGCMFIFAMMVSLAAEDALREIMAWFSAYL